MHIVKLCTYKCRECGHKYYAPQEAEECERHDQVGSYSMMAGIALNMQRFEEALQYYNKALNIYPDEAGFLAGKGIALEALSRFDEAQVCYGKAVEIRQKGIAARSNAVKERSKVLQLAA